MAFKLFNISYLVVVINVLFVIGANSLGFRKSYSAFDADCGMVDSISNNRIVGGAETQPNEFPWQAFLQVEMQSGNAYACGGTLIADRWILTAARCLVVPGQKVRYIDVYLGAHDRTAESEDNRKLYSNSETFIHPAWNPATDAGDIALIKLKSAVKYSQYIRPVCLSISGIDEPDYVNEMVTVTGWGTTYDGSPRMSPVLHKMTVPVISNNDCRATYGDNITDDIMCTSGANNMGTCIGDSGGPMNYKQPDGRWKQIGIISFGSTEGCQKGHPNGYTRLSSYSSTWIKDVIETTSGTHPTTSAFLSTPLIFVSIAFVTACF
ncbi:brachyurin-like [Daphnia pulex]|uniref:brachyurin-like n=1 Tax=Daphnia pulex TaxID=6669 RepID=UPI001EDCA74E|nr:brachyurin-like [Daphnia pulex]